MTFETIRNIQECLTVRKNGGTKKIVDVETLLKRHGNGQVLSLLLDLQKEKQGELIRLMKGDRSRHEIDEAVAQLFRLHMAVKVIQREMEVKPNCQN
jgi:hypothetical protein